MIFHPLYLINSTSDSSCHEETNRLIKESKVVPLHQATTPCRAFERWLAGSRRRILMYYRQEMAPLCSGTLTSLLSMLLQVKNTQSGGEERGPTNQPPGAAASILVTHWVADVTDLVQTPECTSQNMSQFAFGICQPGQDRDGTSHIQATAEYHCNFQNSSM